MNLAFDFEDLAAVEFGVGIEDGEARQFFYVPVDRAVQTVLVGMAKVTWKAQVNGERPPARYQASEKHASVEALYAPLDSDLCSRLRDLHEADNLPSNSEVLKNLLDIFCYLVRLTDMKGRRLTAVRRATQFKGIRKKSLLRFVSDVLRLVEEQVFKLDADFDFLIDEKTVHILRPSGFEFIGQLREAILSAAPKNIATLEKALSFVDFEKTRNYVVKHPRAARYLASICDRTDISAIDRRELKRECTRNGVKARSLKGKLTVDESDALAFLEVLDRRRYEVVLVKHSPEHYRAASRSKVESRLESAEARKPSS